MKTLLRFLKKLSFDLSFPLPWGLSLSLPLPLPLSFWEKISSFRSFLTRSFCKKRRETLILEFWRAIEYFAVQQIPALTPPPKPSPSPYTRSKSLAASAAVPFEQVFSYEPLQRLPWEAQHWMSQTPRKKNSFLRFQIFGGVYPIRRIHQTLQDKCGKDEAWERDLEEANQPLEGDTCAYSFCITEEGRPLFDSFVIPTGAWALGRTLNPGPQDPSWLKGFDNFEIEAKQAFIRHFAIKDDDVPGQALKEFNVGRVIKAEELLAYNTQTLEDLGLANFLPSSSIRFKAFPMRENLKLPEKGRYRVGDPEFLNSFFSDDLKKVAKDVNDRDCGQGLKRFLSHTNAIDPRKRIDLRQNTREIVASLAPQRFPSGCWPTKGHHPLATSQQFAVNTILSDLSAAPGILAVNGPPGTGKTTLLRDLISGIVVERANRLSRLLRPADAFEGMDTWKVNDYTRTISLWKPAFKGFEIVVASSNNGALDNVTLEIPGRSAIDPFWESKGDYFADLASAVLGQPAWGLLGARLGSKSNCYAFQTPFWFGKKKEDRFGGQSVFPSASEPSNPHATLDPPPFSQPSAEQHQTFKEILDAFSTSAPSLDWKAAVRQFKAALEEEKAKRAEAEEIHDVFQQAISCQEALKRVPEFIRSAPLVSPLIRAIHKKYMLKKMDSLQKRLASKLPSFSLQAWLDDEKAREISIPWLTPDWFQARAKVFIEALALHKAFITANAGIIKKNLIGAMDILQGTVPLGTSPSTIAASWSTLFLVVPVVSTTFASFSRLFSHVGQEGLGWLLIDEAGQALPQAAAGAIWRAKRTVVVGDPMQLKPVITLPLSAQATLQRHFQTETTWIPGRTSVQELADRICAYGTLIQRNHSRQWVGMPLRVHRRCEIPEFTLSNAISYGGLMIFGTPERPPLSLPQSRWIHIEAPSFDHTHWIPEEGDAVHHLLSRLAQGGIPRSSIFIVSPFRSVVKTLKETLQKIHKGVNVGTIHTTQGKEADVVILVLGGNPQKPGAKRWASQEPNLLNVAATRAKRRFYS